MEYIIDIILAAIFIIIVAVSAKKGFFKSLIDFAGTIVAFIGAKILSDACAPIVYENFLKKGVESALSKNLGEVAVADYTSQAESVIASIPESLNGILQIIGFDKNALIEKVEALNLNGDNLLESLMNTIVDPLATAILSFVLLAVLALVLIILIKILSKLLDEVIKKLPVIKSCNTLLGGVFGVLRGLIGVVVLSMVISLVVSFTNNSELIMSAESSIIINTVKGLIASFSGLKI
ncbi:MAG: CvpA family protein [Acutalibacteraceae bacterium]